jgi:N-acyl-D-amino-acid deacylase
VVEEASGESFEKYVRERVLAPMGITRMRMERKDYGPGEVRRYAAGGRKEVKGGYPVPAGETTDREYGGNWVASAPDLVRFLTALDGSRGKPFLKRQTTAQMLAGGAVQHQLRQGRLRARDGCGPQAHPTGHPPGQDLAGA